MGGSILGTPHFGPTRGHLPFFAVFDSWASADHLDHPHTYGYPTYRPQTHLSWGQPKLNSFFSFPIPHTGGNIQIYTMATQRMACESYTSTTLGEPIPTQGWSLTSIVTHTPYLHHHPYANTDASRPFTTYTSRTRIIPALPAYYTSGLYYFVRLLVYDFLTPPWNQVLRAYVLRLAQKYGLQNIPVSCSDDCTVLTSATKQQ